MNPLKGALLILMALFYVYAGVLHFQVPEAYRPMMPPYLPAHLALVYLSGLFEIALGIGVLIPPLRALCAWGLVALLLAVLPANIHIALHDIPVFGAEQGAGALNWVRVALQAVLIVWAWWYTGPRQPSLDSAVPA